MRTVSVSELKAHLSRYLRDVRRGGEVQILDRGRPVARLVSFTPEASGPDDHLRDRLVRAGILRAGTGNSAFLLDTTLAEVRADLRSTLQEDRGDRV